MTLSTVLRAEHAGGFVIRLWFNDGRIGTVNFEGWLTGPIFEPLETPSNVERFGVDGGTVAWPNGADIAPETLYDAVSARRSDHTL